MNQATANLNNKFLDEIISSRRSICDFTEEMPSHAMVEAVLAADLTGPFASAAVGTALHSFIFVAPMRSSQIGRVIKSG